MAFWKKKRKKQASKASSETGPRKGGKRTPLDLKLAAMDGLAQGLNAREVAELIGVSDASIYKWRKLYEKEGVAGLRKKASSRGVKLRCEALEARIIESALQIRDYVERRNEGRSDPWLLRMGSHSGPVVGGVVGIHKYIYDVFGDTINTAARMESHSAPMKINLSETTRNLATEGFDYAPREPVEVKGKGVMQMFFVEPPGTGESP